MPLRHLRQYNRTWPAKTVLERPGLPTSLSEQQKLRCMRISCSDSRVPANQTAALEPGEVFVHRHVANVTVRCDLNALATIQCAVDLPEDEHLIGCDHCGCAGAGAALSNATIGFVDNSIRHRQGVRKCHTDSPRQLHELRRAVISKVFSSMRPRKLHSLLFNR